MASKQRRPKAAETVLPVEMYRSIWMEIFKRLDYKNLLNVSLVCKHWNNLIFSDMTLSSRFVLTFDVEKQMIPKETIGMIPGRHYRHLSVSSFRLNSLNYLFTVVQQLAGELDSLKLRLTIFDCQLLELLLPLFKRLNELDIKVEYFEFGDATNIKTKLPTLKKLNLDIANHASTYKKVSLEKVLLPCIPNADMLTISVDSTPDLAIIDFLAPQLKVLNASVHNETIDQFLRLRFPELTSLDLKMMKFTIYGPSCKLVVFQQFFLECKNLTILVLQNCEFDEKPLSMIISTIPQLATLQFIGYSGQMPNSLDGIENLTRLKNLVIPREMSFRSSLPIVPCPSVEYVRFDYLSDRCRDRLRDIVIRFPNLKYLDLRIYDYEEGDLSDIPVHGPQLESLNVYCSKRVRPDLINDTLLLVGLRTLTLEARSFIVESFRLLKKTIALPNLETLTVNTSTKISEELSTFVAAANPTCKLILNGELVKPAQPTTSSE